MSTTSHKTWPKLTSQDEFRFLIELVLNRSTGDHTLVSLHDQQSGTTRFANKQIVQNVDMRRGSLNVTVAFGQRHGTASTTDFTAGAVQETVARATHIAERSPNDPEYLPPVEPQHYVTTPTARPETAFAGPARRLEYTSEAIGQCRMENLGAAGIVSSSIATVGMAASTGLFASFVYSSRRAGPAAAVSGRVVGGVRYDCGSTGGRYSRSSGDRCAIWVALATASCTAPAVKSVVLAVP